MKYEEKLQQIEQAENQIQEIKQKTLSSMKADILQSLIPEYQKALEQANDTKEMVIVEKLQSLFQQVENKIPTIDYTDKLDAVITAIKDGTTSDVIGSLIEDVISSIQALQRQQLASNEELQATIRREIKKILDSLIEVKPSTRYIRDNKGKITKVIENYGNETVTYAWRYDNKGDLIAVDTAKDETS